MGAAVAAVVDRDVVVVSGPDAVRFLHGQVSQDVEALAVGGSAWSLLLQPTGRMVAWVRITRTGDEELLLDVAPGWGTAVVERLSRFKIRVACELTEREGWRAVQVRGAVRPAEPGALDALGVGADCLLVPAAGAGAGVEGFDLLGPDPAVPDGVVIDADAVEADRVAHAVPELGAELDDTVIPAEMGAWFVEDSVSWTKGCYTGQELVARVDSRGANTPRHLRTLQLAGPAAPGDAVLVDGTDVGPVTSVFGTTALAVLKRSAVPPIAATVAGHPASIVR